MAPDASPTGTVDLLDRLKDPAVLAQATEDAIIWATQHGLVRRKGGLDWACTALSGQEPPGVAAVACRFPDRGMAVQWRLYSRFSCLKDSLAIPAETDGRG